MTELVQFTQEDTPLSPYSYDNPAIILDKSRAMANALLDVIDKQTKPDGKNPFKANIAGKDYLTYESWELIARFSNCHLELEGDVQPVYEDEKLVAYTAIERVVDNVTGATIARAQMECGMNSFPTRGKEGREKHKAAMSAAQTWAASKACRMAFSFVSVLGGFEPTTAEEMYGGGDYNAPAPRQSAAPSVTVVDDDDSEYGLCPIHGVEYFKSGRMRSPAHKFEEGGEEKWCNKNSSAWKGELMKAAALAEWSAEQIAEYVKEQYSTTWSKLEFEQAQQVVEFLLELSAGAEEELTFSED